MSNATVQQFMAATAADWRNDAVAFPAEPSALLLFKTEGGSTVKALLPLGPYEVAPPGADFAY